MKPIKTIFSKHGFIFLINNFINYSRVQNNSTAQMLAEKIMSIGLVFFYSSSLEKADKKNQIFCAKMTSRMAS